MVEGGGRSSLLWQGITEFWVYGGFWQVFRNAIKPLLKQKKRKKTSENKWALRNRQEEGGGHRFFDKALLNSEFMGFLASVT